MEQETTLFGGKTCIKCGQWFPLTSFYKQKGAADGTRNTCASCVAKQRATWNEAHPERVALYQERHNEKEKAVRKEASDDRRCERIASGQRICTKCGSEKPTSDFNKQKKGWLGLRPVCRECDQRLVSDWYSSNKKRAIENNRRSRWAYVARRYSAGGKITRKEWRDLLDRCEHKCLACGSAKDLCLDHVISLSKGGRNVIENAQVLCRSCNSKKRSKTIDYRPFTNTDE